MDPHDPYRRPPISSPFEPQYPPPVDLGDRPKKWGCFMIGLWIYSMLTMLFFLGVCLFLAIWPEPSTAPKDRWDVLYAAALLLPSAIYVFISGLKGTRG